MNLYMNLWRTFFIKVITFSPIVPIWSLLPHDIEYTLSNFKHSTVFKVFSNTHLNYDFQWKHTFNKGWHRIMYIISQKGKNKVTVRKYWSKLGVKPRMMNTKCYSSKSGITGLRSLFFCLKHTSFFVLVQLPVYSSPWQISHGSGICNMLGSLSQPRLHCHSFVQCPLKSSCLGFWSNHALSGLRIFPKPQQKNLKLPQSCICHTFKRNTM